MPEGGGSLRTGPRRGRRWPLDLAAAFGVCCLAAMGAAHVTGVRPLIVAGSSMEPTVALGSLAVAVETPATRLVEGDVVSVVRDDRARVTHRLVSVDPISVDPAAPTPSAADPARRGLSSLGSGLAELTLQGDANASPDATRPIVRSVDRVVWTVPGVGRVLQALRSPMATFVLGTFVGLAIWSAGRARTRPTRAVLWVDDVPYQVLP